MKALTPRQSQVLEFVSEYVRREGFWPSVREIQSHFRFRSTNAVAGHLRALQLKGAIERVPGQARAFRAGVGGQATARGQALELVEIPVFGSIAAGYPDGVEQGNALGRLQVDVETAGAGRTQRPFALRVSGESMIEAGIFDGDTVVVEPRPPRHGDIVVALIDGQSTLKRFVKNGAEPPRLKSENRDYPTLRPVAELIIQGVATSVIRRL